MGVLLKLKPDVPVEIALSCADGVNVVSPRGTPAVKYTLVDGRTFYATQYVATQFRSMKIEPNERIRLCMRNIDGKSITAVERVPTSDLRPAAPAEHVEASSPTRNEITSEGTSDPQRLNGGASGNHPSPDPEPN